MSHKKQQYSAKDILIIILVNAILLIPTCIISGTVTFYLNIIELGDSGLYADLPLLILSITLVVTGIVNVILLNALRVKNIG